MVTINYIPTQDNRFFYCIDDCLWDKYTKINVASFPDRHRWLLTDVLF